MTGDLRRRLRDLDPAPVDARPPSGALEADAALRAIERRMGMETRKQTRETTSATNTGTGRKEARSEPLTVSPPPPSQTRQPRYRGLAWGAAAFVAVLGFGVLFLVFAGNDDVEPAQTTVATTASPDVETMTDLEVVEAGVAAFYSGDAERAAELFELTDHTDEELRAAIAAWYSEDNGAGTAAELAAAFFEDTERTDDEIRAESAYQAAIGGRVNLSCTEGTPPWSFMCRTTYQNAMTDAIGYGGGSDVWPAEPVVVEDGVITQFGFTEHTWILESMGTFLASEGRSEGYEDCVVGPFPESCATIQMENLDAWATWYETNN
jgi:hypothetical protein